VPGSHAIRFEELPWLAVSAHARQKRIVSEDRIVRLLELEQGFQEVDWCCNSHIGYVISGELQLNFITHNESFHSGDALILAGGDDGKHKATVVEGPVVLFLVEPA
jgi:hypothetical protein